MRFFFIKKCANSIPTGGQLVCNATMGIFFVRTNKDRNTEHMSFIIIIYHREFWYLPISKVWGKNTSVFFSLFFEVEKTVR